MSCSDRASGRRPARSGRAAALLALVLLTSACAGAADADVPPSAAPAGTPADAVTRAIAEVEFARQCTVASTTFADEADLTTDLDDRLAAAGFTHLQWKEWHDALVTSPELVAQVAEISAAGCPAG